jgi:uncharacterized protein (DUF3820 family)
MDNIIDELELTDLIPFGKYEGQTVQEVLDEDPEYLVWLDGQTDCKIAEHILDSIEE